MSTRKAMNQQIAETVMNYKNEAETGKLSRTMQNRKNFDMYHMRQDFSHKVKGQSKEFLPRQSMAVEQISQFLHQGLIDLGDFFSVSTRPGIKDPLLTKDEMRKLILNEFDKADFYTFVEDALKSGLLGSLMIAKVHGQMFANPHYFTRKNFSSGKTSLLKKKKESWGLKLDLVRQKNYFPDPTNENLYKVELIEKDLWEVKKLAKDNSEFFDSAQMADLESHCSGTNTIDQTDKAREQNQNPTNMGYRKRIRLYECWGNLIDSASGELLHERVVTLVAEDRFVIMPPMPFPYWTNEDPYVVAPLIRVPHSAWHKALMDGPTFLNQAVNEIFNLVIDGGMQSVFGIKQLREHWMDDPSQAEDGLTAGMTLLVNQSAPPDAKVIERVDTGNAFSEGTNAFNIASAELNQSALQNDLRVGTLPPRAVKATEVVEASQSITSVFTGIGKTTESKFVEPIISKTSSLISQEFTNMNRDELESILGKKRVAELFKVPQEEFFARTVRSHVFKVFGISQTLDKIKDFRKLTTLLQTIGSDPTMQEAFVKKYDLTKLLQKIIESLGIDCDEIKHDDADMEMNSLADQEPGETGAPAGPDYQSQIPQMSAVNPSQMTSSQMDQGNFPSGGNQ